MAELEHIGIATRDAKALLRVFEELFGDRPYKSEEVGSDRVRTHFLQVVCSKLEFLESLDPSSPIARFLEKRGEGLHHLAFEVDDIDAAFARARDLGYRPIDEAPREGADGKQVFFLHPKETAGVLIELCQSRRSILQRRRSGAGVTLREAGSSDRPRLTFLHEKTVTVDLDELARRLESRFYFLAVEAQTDVTTKTIREVLSDGAGHLVASTALVSQAVRYAAAHPAAVQSLVLLHPPGDVPAAAIDVPTLVVARDDLNFETALTVHAALSRSRLAVLPGVDVDMIADLIAQHADMGRDAHNPT